MWDLWLPPSVEVVVGCVVLVLSAGFWNSRDAGAVWDLKHWPWTVGAILGPWFVYRAWKRKPETLRCYSCGKHVPVIEYDSDGVKFWTLDCPRCGDKEVAPVDVEGRLIFPPK
jgi:hypothetical protein